MKTSGADYNQAFGRVIRNQRKASGYSQEKLGFEAGYDRSYISLIERGLCSPTLSTIMSLCAALEVSLVQIAQAVETTLQIEKNGNRSNSPTGAD
ncbi:helix-turn-helix domain-containing protein [Stutzerimonas stutzeri]|uniref:helix-turn-helix domain-containing protein n=1 Tax=Stutzerimonas stutzeri TaxID=316 RepID=UPI00265CAE13|nr:helix-turn-helix transcriptional regulator [Stutzerimonas stutzeri]MCF6783690.1 helix-turn-helix domain-containing protein [Stutzerimonas stutzeri]